MANSMYNNNTSPCTKIAESNALTSMSPGSPLPSGDDVGSGFFFKSWQTALSNVITSVDELCAILDLDSHLIFPGQQAHKLFPLRVPRCFVQRMEKGNPDDPLLRQVLPIAEELMITPGYTNDPLAEKAANPLPGLLHKYHGRVLLLVAGECAVHCRYCFRREFPYSENSPGTNGWNAVIDYIAADTSISEVIFSGGDPLIAKDKILADLVEKLAVIPHVQRLRIHTRLPIVIPERITDELLQWLTQTRLQPVMVLHCNHANEIDSTVIAAIQKLRHAGITVLNQSVLLKGVNDNAAALIALSEKSFAAGMLPYYLHLLDRVQGAAHFFVPEETALHLLQEIMTQLPGYLVPKLVCEKSGAASKIIVA